MAGGLGGKGLLPKRGGCCRWGGGSSVVCRHPLSAGVHCTPWTGASSRGASAPSFPCGWCPLPLPLLPLTRPRHRSSMDLEVIIDCKKTRPRPPLLWRPASPHLLLRRFPVPRPPPPYVPSGPFPCPCSLLPPLPPAPLPFPCLFPPLSPPAPFPLLPAAARRRCPTPAPSGCVPRPTRSPSPRPLPHPSSPSWTCSCYTTRRCSCGTVTVTAGVLGGVRPPALVASRCCPSGKGARGTRGPFGGKGFCSLRWAWLGR